MVTGSRAEFGLLRGLMEEIRAHDALELQVAVTGMHLSPEFGLTVTEVEQDFHVDRQVEMLLSSDSAAGVAKSMGLGLIGFADAWQELRPDLVVHIPRDARPLFIEGSFRLQPGHAQREAAPRHKTHDPR